MSSNNDRETISEMTTGRLSVYLRCLTFLESQAQKTVSSHEMAKRFHLNSAQIRKDLACFGEFGTRGVGYDVTRLKAQLVETLGIDRTRTVIIVGAGNLGMALADYTGFNTNGFHVVAMVDADPAKTGRESRQGIPVHAWERLADIVRRNRVEIGIIAVPAESAQSVYDALADAGVHAVLNFAPVQLRLRPDVKVKSVDLRINLESLSFHLKNVEDGIV
ncbi:MAG TPA: redox-sensing transcriptional repressor Rex [Thermoanaerobaculia bacterium]|jgi:redox-sensing transcriptional repressor|nr:redox-sensing transcriptional repressor Rex [Thermoanaerobaculia bacterium]